MPSERKKREDSSNEHAKLELHLVVAFQADYAFSLLQQRQAALKKAQDAVTAAQTELVQLQNNVLAKQQAVDKVKAARKATGAGKDRAMSPGAKAEVKATETQHLKTMRVAIETCILCANRAHAQLLSPRSELEFGASLQVKRKSRDLAR